MPIKLNGSTSGYTQVDAAAVAANNTLLLPTTGTTLLSDSYTGNITITGNLTVTGDLIPSSSFLRNRIINGDMRIDQRNAGASVSVQTGTGYTLDRWGVSTAVNSKYTVQQNAGSVTPPAGYSNYLGVTSSAATTPGSSDSYDIRQKIEGFNVADLAWGTASAATVTLSFWVRSSLTGTFGGALSNNAFNRSYPFTYTISAANTWEQKSVTIAGDTTGTWLTNNGIGIQLFFSLGTGATLSGTAGAWAAAGYTSATGATSVVGTNGATFYVTGVQLEVGSNATPFERRLYGQELALCERYYQLINSVYMTAYLALAAGNNLQITISLPVTMRTAPTASGSGWTVQNVPSPTITTTINTAVFDAVSTVAGNCFYRTTTPTTFNAEL